MREPRRRVIGTLVFLLLLVASDLNAQQTARLQGTVTNSLNDRPLAGITVSLVGTRLVTLTSGDGTYRLQAVPPGRRRDHALVLRQEACQQKIMWGR